MTANGFRRREVRVDPVRSVKRLVVYALVALLWLTMRKRPAGAAHQR